MGVTHSIAANGMAIFQSPICSTIGGLVIDLASAPIEPGQHELQIETSIGGIEVYVPRHVTFTIEGGAALGGCDIHDGHGFWNTLGRRLGRLVGWNGPIPDQAVAPVDGAKPTSIKLVIAGGIGGVDIYRI
jgi:hypothetical protein